MSKKDGYVIFRRISERQHNYWTTNSLPCIIVLNNPDNDDCVWQYLTKDTIEITKDGNGKGFFVRVPVNQIFLDLMSQNKLLSYTNLPEHITNYNFLLSQKVFMQIILDGGVIKLHSTEWVNKSSGRGKTELIVNDGKGVKVYPYPYWFPYTPYEIMFPKLFPWAKFEADEDFLEEQDEEMWREYHCFYNKGDDEWIIVGDTFEEFRSKLSAMRSINSSGEVAEYMMVHKLNELGRSFLAVDEFVSNKRLYVNARPSKQ